mmetsp:Transcript_9673/g.24768  ORF Transcript_9673/g.24768 Transcript_9673/m.24768 type:complete len:238 (+) Transcript_9673:573-1286(+)
MVALGERSHYFTHRSLFLSVRECDHRPRHRGVRGGPAGARIFDEGHDPNPGGDRGPDDDCRHRRITSRALPGQRVAVYGRKCEVDSLALLEKLVPLGPAHGHPLRHDRRAMALLSAPAAYSQGREVSAEQAVGEGGAPEPGQAHAPAGELLPLRTHFGWYLLVHRYDGPKPPARGQRGVGAAGQTARRGHRLPVPREHHRDTYADRGQQQPAKHAGAVRFQRRVHRAWTPRVLDADR